MPSSNYKPLAVSNKGLAQYLRDIQKFPILDREEEYILAKRWQEHHDEKAAQKLINSHLRLVAKMAMGYRGYGLPIAEVMSEGNIGLMRAVKHFNPDKGARFSTYATWWIKASIQEYVLRSWSLVKTGTTSAHKKLFFNLRKIKQRIRRTDIDTPLTVDETQSIAKTLGVRKEDVDHMNIRLTQGDVSLNTARYINGDSQGQWQDWIPDDTLDQEHALALKDEVSWRREQLAQAMNHLSKREKDIIDQRHLQQPPITLQKLSKKYEISAERIRQIEKKSIKKLQKIVGGKEQITGGKEPFLHSTSSKKNPQKDYAPL